MVLFLNTNVQCQLLNSSLTELHRLQGLRIENMFNENRDSIFQLFDSLAYQLMVSNELCQSSLDSSAIYKISSNYDSDISLAYSFINNWVRSSVDDRIRLFSWDDLGGGSYHTYTNYLQYKTSDNRCITTPFDTLHSNIEVGYYQIDKFIKDETHIYVFLGYGTYGGGQQHKRIRLFEFVDDQPEERFDLYPNGKDLVVFSNRGQDPEIVLDKQEGIIRYMNYHYDKEIGFYQQDFTLETIQLFRK